MAKNIRSKYIKNLIDEQKGIDAKLEETTKETLRSILKETVSDEFKKILSESDDDYEEEEVTADGAIDAADEVPVDTPDETEGGEDTAEEPELGGADAEEGEDAAGADEEGIWDSLEQYKNEDGEYDLTGFSAENAARVLKVMDPNKDGVRIVRKGDKIELSDEANDAEYVIELEPEPENEYEIDIEESVDECGNANMFESENTGNTGYTDNYQRKTAMTMDPDDGAKTRKWNAGTPTGNGKRWVGNKGDMSPYNKKVNEEAIVEVVTDDMEDEAAETMSNKRTMKDLHNHHNGEPRHDRHRIGAQNPTMNRRTEESIKRKANEIFRENKQLKQVAEKIMKKLDEAYVLNHNLGKIIKLVTENATTRDEKIDIVNRFNDTRSIDESNRVYEQIDRELKSSKQTSNVDKMVNGTITEAKQPGVVETSLYQSDDLYKTINMMERLERIK